VKEAVFPFNRFPGVDVLLGPEMKSTGEVMGLDSSFERAFLKSQLGAGVKLPEGGTGLHLGEGQRQGAAVTLARRLSEMGFRIAPPAAPRRGSGRPGWTAGGQQGAGRPPALRGRDQVRRIQLVINTTERRAVGVGQLRHPPQRADPRGAALHDHGRRPGRGARHRGAEGPEPLMWPPSRPIFSAFVLTGGAGARPPVSPPPIVCDTRRPPPAD
jgi:hypothetical protein